MMDTDGVSFGYHKTLQDIDDQLGKRDMKSMNFLCCDILPKAGLENVRRGIELFSLLEKRNFLGPGNTYIVAELLYTIQRYDLLKVLQTTTLEYEQTSKQRGTNLLPYRVMLYRLCNELSTHELDSMKFTAAGYLPRSLVEDITDAEALFMALERADLLQHNNLAVLESLIKPLKQPQLVMILNKYKGMKPSTGCKRPLKPPVVEAPAHHRPVLAHEYPVHSSRQRLVPQPIIHVHATQDEFYKMDAKPRGVCLIINNENFYTVPDDPMSKDLLPRIGTSIDCNNLETTFNGLNFEVHTYHNLTAIQMFQVLNQVAHNRDHTHFDSFICCILSHGVNGSVYGTNGKLIPIVDIIMPFKAVCCPSLAGKPKLFFIQACQGKLKQPAYPDLQTDAPVPEVQELIPNEADFLIGQATVAGYVSYRSKSQGSWYITTLTKLLDEYAFSKDLLDILLMVNREVGSKNAPFSYPEAGELYQMKQIPQPMFTLRKKILFR